MFNISVIILGVITLVLLKIFLNINFKKLKQLEIGSDEKLKNISDKLQNVKSEVICKNILNKFECSNVDICVKPEYSACLYTIGEFKEQYMKPQTIAHECIHASQNKVTLWANFIFTNIYLLFWVVICILSILNKLPNTGIFTIILVFTSLIQYIIRYSLENEAMIKAKYIAKEYIEENKLLNKEQEEILLKEYDRVNNLGIPFMNYYQISMNIVKVMIFSFICII